MSDGAQASKKWGAVTPSAIGLVDDDHVEPAVEFVEPAARRPWGGIIVAALLITLGLAWIAGLAWAVAATTPAGAPDPLRLAAWIGIGSGPLALFAMLYLVLMRSGRSEISAYGRASARLRTDSANLANMLALLNGRLAEARAELGEHGAALATLGEQAGDRMKSAGIALRDEASVFAQVTERLDGATATARADIDVLVNDMPRAHDLAERIARVLREAGSTADAQARALAGLLATLEAQARAAGDTTGGAAARLAGQLDRIEASAAAADQRIEDSAGALGRAIDAAMAAAADGIEETRTAIAAQSAALAAMVDQGRATIGMVGEEATRGLGAQLDALLTRIDGAGAALRVQDQAGRALLNQLELAIGAVEERFAALGDAGANHTADLAEAIVTLAGHADAVTRTLSTSGERADAVLARVVELRAHTDASNGAISDTIPAALARIRLHAEQSLNAIASAGTRTEGLATAAAAVSAQLIEAEQILDRQRHALDDVGNIAAARLSGLNEQADALHAMLTQSGVDVRMLSEGASGQLVDALLRVKETAAQAAEQAQEALSAAIPRATERLAEASARAMQTALAEVGREEIAAVGAASEQAIESARLAAERLSRHLLTIAETSSAIEARVERNRQDTEEHDEGSFARQLGLMIEALNSSAIDVTRMLSTEVGDTEWAAYLKGDRGIFTRRAVKLVTRGEARAIADRYGEEPEFRELANRYIHDFEAMLRRTLAVRDGQTVAATLLSSDMGKVYVSLAQAIERLRS